MLFFNSYAENTLPTGPAAFRARKAAHVIAIGWTESGRPVPIHVRTPQSQAVVTAAEVSLFEFIDNRIPDAPPLTNGVSVTLSTDSNMITEDGAPIIGTVALVDAAGNPVAPTTDITVSLGAFVTPPSKTDYSGVIPDTVTIPAGSSSVQFPISMLSDNSAEMSALVVYIKGVTQSEFEFVNVTEHKSVWTNNPGAAATVGFSSNTLTAYESSSSITLPLTFSVPVSGSYYIYYEFIFQDYVDYDTYKDTGNTSIYLSSSTSTTFTIYMTTEAGVAEADKKFKVRLLGIRPSAGSGAPEIAIDPANAEIDVTVIDAIGTIPISSALPTPFAIRTNPEAPFVGISGPVTGIMPMQNALLGYGEALTIDKIREMEDKGFLPWIEFDVDASAQAQLVSMSVAPPQTSWEPSYFVTSLGHTIVLPNETAPFPGGTTVDIQFVIPQGYTGPFRIWHFGPNLYGQFGTTITSLNVSDYFQFPSYQLSLDKTSSQSDPRVFSGTSVNIGIQFSSFGQQALISDIVNVEVSAPGLESIVDTGIFQVELPPQLPYYPPDTEPVSGYGRLTINISGDTTGLTPAANGSLGTVTARITETGQTISFEVFQSLETDSVLVIDTTSTKNIVPLPDGNQDEYVDVTTGTIMPFTVSLEEMSTTKVVNKWGEYVPARTNTPVVAPHDINITVFAIVRHDNPYGILPPFIIDDSSGNPTPMAIAGIAKNNSSYSFTPNVFSSVDINEHVVAKTRLTIPAGSSSVNGSINFANIWRQDIPYTIEIVAVPDDNNYPNASIASAMEYPFSLKCVPYNSTGEAITAPTFVTTVLDGSGNTVTSITEGDTSTYTIKSYVPDLSPTIDWTLYFELTDYDTYFGFTSKRTYRQVEKTDFSRNYTNILHRTFNVSLPVLGTSSTEQIFVSKYYPLEEAKIRYARSELRNYVQDTIPADIDYSSPTSNPSNAIVANFSIADDTAMQDVWDLEIVPVFAYMSPSLVPQLLTRLPVVGIADKAANLTIVDDDGTAGLYISGGDYDSRIVGNVWEHPSISPVSGYEGSTLVFTLIDIGNIPFEEEYELRIPASATFRPGEEFNRFDDGAIIKIVGDTTQLNTKSEYFNPETEFLDDGTLVARFRLADALGLDKKAFDTIGKTAFTFLMQPAINRIAEGDEVFDIIYTAKLQNKTQTFNATLRDWVDVGRLEYTITGPSSATEGTTQTYTLEITRFGQPYSPVVDVTVPIKIIGYNIGVDLIFPDSVTIPAGSNSATFDVEFPLGVKGRSVVITPFVPNPPSIFFRDDAIYASQLVSISGSGSQFEQYIGLSTAPNITIYQNTTSSQYVRIYDTNGSVVSAPELIRVKVTLIPFKPSANADDFNYLYSYDDYYQYDLDIEAVLYPGSTGALVRFSAAPDPEYAYDQFIVDIQILNDITASIDTVQHILTVR